MRVIVAMLIILTVNQVLVWTPDGQYETVADIPASYGPLEPGERRRTELQVNAASGLIAYTVVTEAYATRRDAGTLPERVQRWHDIYTVDVESGAVTLLAGQTTNVLEQQTPRWDIRFSPDGNRLAWLEIGVGSTGYLVIHDLVADVRSTFASGAIYFTSHLIAFTDSYIIIDQAQLRAYHIFGSDGDYLYSYPYFSDDFYFTYLYEDEGAMYFGTPTDRFNLADGSYSETPNGSLMRIAAAAPDTSVRLSPPVSPADLPCHYNVFSPDGELIYAFRSLETPLLGADGRTLYYRAILSSERPLIMITFDENYVPFEQIYGGREGISNTYAGETKDILVRGGDSFRGDIFCVAG